MESNESLVWSVKAAPVLASEIVAKDLKANTRQAIVNIVSVPLNAKKKAFENLRSALDEIRQNTENYSRCSSRILLDQIRVYIDELEKNLELDPSQLSEIQKGWASAVRLWESEIKEIKMETGCNCQKALFNYQSNLLKLKCIRPEDIITMVQKLILEINQIFINNEQVYTDTGTNLLLLREATLRSWLKRYIIRKRNSMIPKEPVMKVEEPSPPLDDIPWDAKISYMKFLLADGKQSFGLPDDNAGDLLDHLNQCRAKAFEKETEAVEAAERLVKNTKMLPRDVYTHCKELILKTINELEEVIYDDYLVSYLVYHTWRNHLCRLVRAQNVLDYTIRMAKTDRIHAIEEHEVFLSVILDNLRTAPSKGIMDKQLQDANNVVDQIMNEFDEMLQVTNSVIGDAAKVFRLAGEISKSNIRILQESIDFPIDPLPYQTDSKRDSDEEGIEVEFCSSEEVELIRSLIKSIHNWKEGFLVGILNFCLNIGKHVTLWHNDWELQTRTQAEKLYIHLKQSTEGRRKRIQVDIFNVRALELEAHTNRLEEHINAIRAVFREIAMYERNTVKAAMYIRDDFKEKYTAITHEIEESNSLAVNYRLGEKLQDLVRTTQAVRQGLLMDSKRYMSRKLSWLNVASLAFLQNIKLFSEGGNYNSIEVKVMIPTIKKLMSNIHREIKIREKKMNDLIMAVTHEKEMISKVLKDIKNKEAVCLLNEDMKHIMDTTKKSLLKEIARAEVINKELKELMEFESIERAEEFWQNLAEICCASCVFFGKPQSIKRLEFQSNFSAMRNKIKNLDDLGGHSSDRPSTVDKTSRSSKVTLPIVLKKQSLDDKDALDLKKTASVVIQHVSTSITNQDSIQKGKKFTGRFRKGGGLGDTLFKYFPYSSILNEKTDNFVIQTKCTMCRALERAFERGKKDEDNMKPDVIKNAVDLVRKLMTQFNFECEKCWLVLLYDFVGSLSAFHYSFIIDIMVRYEEKKCGLDNELDSLYETFLMEINQINDEGFQERERLRRGLKVWHGFLTNKADLIQLCVEAEHHCKNFAELNIEKVLRYKDTLKKTTEMAVEQMQEFVRNERERYKSIFQGTEIHQLASTLSRFLKLIKAEKSFEVLDYQVNLSHQSEDNFLPLTMSSCAKAEYLIENLVTLLKLIQNEDDFDTMMGIARSIRGVAGEASESTARNIVINNKDDVTTFIFEDYQKKFKERLLYCSNMLTSLGEHLQDWYDEWELNVKTVNKLYNVSPFY